MDVLSFGLGGRLLRQAAYARAAAIEIVTLTGHVLRYPTGIFQERVAQSIVSGGGDAQREPRLPVAGLDQPPVLLLHGFVDNRSVFAPMQRSLRQHGWMHVQALNYSPLTCDVRTAATLLSRHVERICEQSGHRHVDIVGHSLGGLIARYYVQRLSGDARVRTLVTLGTPHAGTTAVPLLNPHPIVRQMRPGSDLMDELAKSASHCRTRFVAFWSDLDEMMIPVETARLDHPDLIKENVQISGMGHLTMPAHGSIAAAIRQALVGQTPTPGAVDAA
jgi:triacylglycerol esterase/lipase EstA (alpha/beta hydrolase family)